MEWGGFWQGTVVGVLWCLPRLTVRNASVTWQPRSSDNRTDTMRGGVPSMLTGIQLLSCPCFDSEKLYTW